MKRQLAILLLLALLPGALSAGDISLATLRGNIASASWTETTDSGGQVTRSNAAIRIWNYGYEAPNEVWINCRGTAEAFCMTPEILGCAWVIETKQSEPSPGFSRITRRCINNLNRDEGNCIYIYGYLGPSGFNAIAASGIVIDQRTSCTPK